MKNTFQRIARRGGLLLLLTAAAGFAFAAETTPAISKSDIKQLIAKATTPANHHELALYFTQKAEMMDAEAVEHEALAKEYANNPGIWAMKQPMSGKTAAHCKYFAQAARKAATEDRALAAAHEDMAKHAAK